MAAVERLHAGGFDVAELTVGKATIRLNRARGGERDRDDQPAQPTGIYAQHGGEFLARVAAEVIPGVDLQPAIGRVG